MYYRVGSLPMYGKSAYTRIYQQLPKSTSLLYTLIHFSSQGCRHEARCVHTTYCFQSGERTKVEEVQLAVDTLMDDKKRMAHDDMLDRVCCPIYMRLLAHIRSQSPTWLQHATTHQRSEAPPEHYSTFANCAMVSDPIILRFCV